MSIKLSKSESYNQVFGKYSHGAGAILDTPDKICNKIDDPEVIEAYIKTIKFDLDRMGISESSLKDFTVLDVGGGRQAIAFHSLGAKKVYHYDIGPNNVKRLEDFIEANSIQNKIMTECVDLVSYSPPQDQFDLVYLHGIAHHFSHTGVGLINCMRSMKKGGYLWFYFYRSGTFHHFVVQMLRDLINLTGVDMKEWYMNAVIGLSADCKLNHAASDFMDDLFATYYNLYTSDQCISFVRACGFDVTFSSKLDPMGADISHQYAHSSVILVCKKMSETDLNKEQSEILSPEKSINQLDEKMYSNEDHQTILQSINEHSLLKELLLTSNVPKTFIIMLVLGIFKFLRGVDIKDAIKVSRDFNFPHYVFDYQSEFKSDRFSIPAEFKSVGFFTNGVYECVG